MKKKNILVTVFLLIATFAFLSSCKRTGVEEPTPFSPSSFTSILILSTSSNTILAGDILAGYSRQLVTITATFKKYNGSPISGRNLYFEVIDGSGNPVNLGYFEGNQSVRTKVTDSSGIAKVTYYGPYAQEITSSGKIYIRATVSWELVEQISEITPLEIIRDPNAIDYTQIVYTYGAFPDVLYASEEKPQSTIEARLYVGSSVPLPHFKVYFLIESGGPGVFSDGLKATFVETNDQGVAAINYVGPTKDEIAGDTSVNIRVQLTESEYKLIPIRIIKKR